MKKNMLAIGTTLTKREQQKIHGGSSDWDCGPQYSQAQCDDYCNSMDLVHVNALENEDWGNADLAFDALMDLCGLGNPSVL